MHREAGHAGSTAAGRQVAGESGSRVAGLNLSMQRAHGELVRGAVATARAVPGMRRAGGSGTGGSGVWCASAEGRASSSQGNSHGVPCSCPSAKSANALFN